MTAHALIFYLIWFKVENEENNTLKVSESLKGHSQLWDRADLDTGFLTLKRVHASVKSKYI